MRTDRELVVGASVSHEDATLDQLESATLKNDAETIETLLDHPAISEAFVLQTCNRIEAYVVTEQPERGRALLTTLFDRVDEGVVTEMGHEESIRHLFRVSAGLESLVIGEDQILGQVRDAYETARGAGGIGATLDATVTKAIRVGERARTETAINEGVVSLASAAVKLAAEKHGLDESSAVVIGAGEMGTLAAKRLSGRIDELVLANRTPERAHRLADRLDEDKTSVDVTGLDSLTETLAAHDIVISATGSPDWILDPDDCRALGETFIIDITRPRDIPPAADEVDDLTVYDLDRLEAVTAKTRQRRQQAAEHVEALLDEEFSRLHTQYKRKRADTVISAMYEGAERIKANELETTFEKADFDDEERAHIEAMATSIVNQLLAPPTNSLRDAAEADDWSTIHTALKLFNPNFDQDGYNVETEYPLRHIQATSSDSLSGETRDDFPPASRERLSEESNEEHSTESLQSDD